MVEASIELVPEIKNGPNENDDDQSDAEDHFRDHFRAIPESNALERVRGKRILLPQLIAGCSKRYTHSEYKTWSHAFNAAQDRRDGDSVARVKCGSADLSRTNCAILSSWRATRDEKENVWRITIKKTLRRERRPD